MTDLEWTQYGDASASHQTTEIAGVSYSELRYVVTYEGREWGYFSPSDLVDMNLTPESKNVRVAQGPAIETTVSTLAETNEDHLSLGKD